MKYDILIVGVGGQGTLLASRVLGAYGTSLGFDVKLSEVHGMSQRGGSVVTHVRIGEKVFSPTVSEGLADVVLAFERLEAVRYAHFLKPDGLLLASDTEIAPLSVAVGAAEYPTGLGDMFRERGVKYLEIPAAELVSRAGSAKSVNVVMLAVLSKLLGFDKEKFESAVLDAVPEKSRAVNKKALEIGCNFTS